MAVFNVESNGVGFSQDGRLRIRFENHVFLANDYSFGTQNFALGQNSSHFGTYFTFNTSSRTTGHRFDTTGNGDFDKGIFAEGMTSIHRTGTMADIDFQYQAFELAKKLNEDAAYMAISSGVSQIMGFNYDKYGFSSAKEMFERMSRGIKEQIDMFFEFVEAKSELHNAFRSNTQTNRSTISNQYNGWSIGSDGHANYMRKLDDSYTTVTDCPEFER